VKALAAIVERHGVPVRASTAAESGGGGGIGFNRLHAECNSRIPLKKICPIHSGVPASEIVKGYEFDEGKYVIVDPARSRNCGAPRRRR
jgi:non-homologous end joining protein Ku